MNSAVHLIINTGSRRSRDVLPRVIAAMKQYSIPADAVHDLHQTNNSQQLVKTIIADKPKLVVIAGGDGTVSALLQQFAYSNIEIGIVPLGTTNNFARSLKLSLDTARAVQTIARSKAKPVDLGNMNGHYFANVIGIGLSARIAKHVSDKSKKRFGRYAYGLTGLKQITHQGAFKVSVGDTNHDLRMYVETRQLIIANGSFHAGRKIAEDAKMNNRELIIFALGSRSLRSMFWHTFDFYVGKRKKIIHASYLTGRHIIVATNTPQIVEVDGEIIGSTPLEISIAPAAVHVRYSV